MTVVVCLFYKGNFVGYAAGYDGDHERYMVGRVVFAASLFTPSEARGIVRYQKKNGPFDCSVRQWPPQKRGGTYYRGDGLPPEIGYYVGPDWDLA